MATNDALSRRELLGTAKAAGLAALGVALLPAASQAGLKDYPNLEEAHDYLVKARKALDGAKKEFGGHRVKAMERIDDALEEIRLGVKFADG
jgi:hypothetical protein